MPPRCAGYVILYDSDGPLIPLTVNEIRRLSAIWNQPARRPGHREHWSRWRRRHQARAQLSHYRRRGQPENHRLRL